MPTPPPNAALSKPTLLATLSLLMLLATSTPTNAAPIDQSQHAQAHAAIQRAHAFLATTQQDDGSWSPQPGPAITALVLRGMLQQTDPDHRATLAQPIANARQLLLNAVQPDGSIRTGPDGILANYNTAIAVSALAQLPPTDTQAQAAVRGGVNFLKGLQWSAGMEDPKGNAVDEDHPFFGGAGYGKHGRPDLSNTQIMVQALHDAGLPPDDPAYQRALTFISRLQGSAANTYFPPGTLEQDGGVIYATSVNQDTIGVPQSMANPDQIDQARAGRPVSGLRGYGSMTYAAFKSYLYADLKPDDQRVHDALQWIKAHYTLDRNPGMPADLDQQGLFYYYLTHARALSAFGRPTLDTTDQGTIDWRANLIAALLERQADDGSWTNPEPRWMESDPNLVTAYAVLALQETLQ